MTNKLFKIFSTIILLLFVSFIVFIHLNSLKPSFQTLKDNDIINMKSGELLYYGSSSCEVCQEFNKVLKDYQDLTHVEIYYWDATNMAIVNKAAKVGIYNTPTILVKEDDGYRISQGYQSLEELEKFVIGD